MNAISATDTGLLALQTHCSDVQVTATQLCGVLEAIAILDNENVGANAVSSLIGVAITLADTINQQLDSATLPGGAA